jgi:oxaloacetate decarboxylase alpha subunit
LLDDEMDKLTQELQQLAKEHQFTLAQDSIDDVLTYALFPQVGLKFLQNRNNPEAFEPVPTKPQPSVETAENKSSAAAESYSVSVDGKVYEVVVAQGGKIENIQVSQGSGGEVLKQSASVQGEETLNAPLAGNIFKIVVKEGQQVQAGDVVIIMEAMKMETEIRAVTGGTINRIHVGVGDAVTVGQVLLTVA